MRKAREGGKKANGRKGNESTRERGKGSGKVRKGREPQDRKVERSRARAVAHSARVFWKMKSQLVNLNSHVSPEPTERFEVECLCEEVGNIEMSCNVGHS